MYLNHKISGTGNPVILLHGMFGAKENLGMLARPLSEQFQTICVDLRNHGSSFHAEEMNYPAMAEDVLQLMDDLNLDDANIVGHSMGAKVAMQMALSQPQRIRSLSILDIASHAYQPHHSQILQGLQAIQAATIENRAQADDLLKQYESDQPTRQFLLTNLVRNDRKQLGLRLNVDAIVRHQQALSQGVSGPPFTGPTLLLRGANSDYVSDNALTEFSNLFPNYKLETISDAGHMLHAENTQDVMTALLELLNNQEPHHVDDTGH